jgi:hypothetical protein
MQRLVVLVAGGLAAIASSGDAIAALPGKVISRGVATGRLAITTTQVEVQRPKALYVRLGDAGVRNATLIVGCVKSFGGSSSSYSRTKPGVYRLPIKPAGADSCRVIASVGGSGRIVVEVRVVQ